MSLNLLIIFSTFIFGLFGADLHCKSFRGDLLYNSPQWPVDVCLKASIDGDMQSFEYVCLKDDDGEYEIFIYYYGGVDDCKFDDDSEPVMIQQETDQDLIDCESSSCSYTIVRMYEADEDGNSCDKDNDNYVEEAIVVDECISFGILGK